VEPYQRPRWGVGEWCGRPTAVGRWDPDGTLRLSTDYQSMSTCAALTPPFHVLQSLPDFCMVHFPGYTGPPILPWDPKVVPVTPQEIFSDCHHHCSRTQIPLVANYARTIHKCQGITCGPGHVDEYFVTDLGEKSAESRWSGIAFVTLSRASVVSHLGISGTLNYDRLQIIGKNPKSLRVRTFDTWVQKSSDSFLKSKHFLDNNESLDFLVEWVKSCPARREKQQGGFTSCPPKSWPRKY
jgi:hypothetical protein